MPVGCVLSGRCRPFERESSGHLGTVPGRVSAAGNRAWAWSVRVLVIAGDPVGQALGELLEGGQDGGEHPGDVSSGVLVTDRVHAR